MYILVLLNMLMYVNIEIPCMFSYHMISQCWKAMYYELLAIACFKMYTLILFNCLGTKDF